MKIIQKISQDKHCCMYGASLRASCPGIGGPTRLIPRLILLTYGNKISPDNQDSSYKARSRLGRLARLSNKHKIKINKKLLQTRNLAEAGQLGTLSGYMSWHASI